MASDLVVIRKTGGKVMLNKIARVLFGKRDEAVKTSKTKLVEGYDAKGTNAVSLFLSSIKGVGHPEYPILDKNYSPSSRVPCVDLVPFISKCINDGDINSIKTVMRSVIEGNPGLGIGSSWIDESVDYILSIPFEKYVTFLSPNALPELKALFIVAAKGGGGREFLITDEIPRLILWACISYQPIWSDNLQTLAKKANSWIDKMAKDTPYWEGYEKFGVEEIPNKIIDTDLGEIISALTPAARLQLFYAMEKGGGALSELTNYQIRSFGIDVETTSLELIESGLVEFSFSNNVIEQAHSKKELIELCDEHAATYRKSWKKEKLVEALEKVNPDVLKEIGKSKNLVAPNYHRYLNLKNIAAIAKRHQVGFELLCFS